MMVNTRQKGRILVLAIIEQLRQEIDTSTYEVAGSGAGLDKGDIRVPLMDLVIEAKNQKTINVAKWTEQADREGLGHSNTALMWKHPKNGTIRVDIDLGYFIDLAKRYKEPKIKAPDRNLRWKLETLKNNINQVLKEL